MTIAVVQQVTVATASASTRTATIAAATAGNKIIAIGQTFSATVGFSPTTPASGWTTDYNPIQAGSGWQVKYASFTAAGGETTITWTTDDAGSRNVSLIVYEVSGLATSSYFDKSNFTTAATGTSRTTGSTGTLSQADELVLAAMQLNNNYTSPSWDSSLNISTTATRFFAGHLIVSATTAINATASWTNSVSASGSIATYKAATAATVYPPELYEEC